MNQRSKRARDRKKTQDIDVSTIQTGGYVAHHGRNQDPNVRVPKATGDMTEGIRSGLAKASPFFKKLKELKPDSPEEEKKAVAEATEKHTKKKGKVKEE
jgi:hypothetical protein